MPNFTDWTKGSHRKQVLHLNTAHVQAQLSNFGADVYYGNGYGVFPGAGDQLGKGRRWPSTLEMCKDDIRYQSLWWLLASRLTFLDGTEQLSPKGMMSGASQAPVPPEGHNIKANPPFLEPDQKCSKSNAISAPYAGSTGWNTPRG